jgi:hypothetical protein
VHFLPRCAANFAHRVPTTILFQYPHLTSPIKHFNGVDLRHPWKDLLFPNIYTPKIARGRSRASGICILFFQNMAETFFPHSRSLCCFFLLDLPCVFHMTISTPETQMQQPLPKTCRVDPINLIVLAQPPTPINRFNSASIHRISKVNPTPTLPKAQRSIPHAMQT